MNFEISWDDPAQTIILMVFPSARWTWDDHINALDQVGAMLDGCQQPVHFISDLSKSKTWLPPNPMAHFKRVRNFLTHPNIGKIVIVGGGTIVRVFSDIFRKFSPNDSEKYIFVATLKEP